MIGGFRGTGATGGREPTALPLAGPTHKAQATRSSLPRYLPTGPPSENGP